MATTDVAKLLLLTNQTKLTLTVALTLSDTVTVIFLRAFRSFVDTLRKVVSQ